MPLSASSRDSMRACDQCRARKVKCDRGAPCSNCRVSGSACRTTCQEKEPRSRIVISREYEKKIDRIGDRLERIEEILRLTSAPSSSHTGSSGPPDSDSVDHDQDVVSPSEGEGEGDSEPKDENTFDGDASASTHTELANQVFEEVVENSQIVHRVPELSNAMASLRAIVAKVRGNPRQHETERHRLAPPKYARQPLPTPEEMNELLENADSTHTLSFSPVIREAYLREKCEGLMRNPAESTVCRKLFVYGMMHSLCIEYAGYAENPDDAARYTDLAFTFLAHLEIALGELRMIIPANRENLEALIVAASCALDLCRPYLAWTLSTQAASMAQVLGYHRLASMRGDTEDERNRKIYLFWIIYITERSFSVRLGRSSTIHDDDITVPLPPYMDGFPAEHSDISRWHVQVSKIQSQAIQQLYSPPALAQPRQERDGRAAGLCSMLENEWKRRRESAKSELARLRLESHSIMHYSTLALIQHATCSPSFSQSPALETSRTALRLTVESRKTFRHLHDYIWSYHCHWVLLHCPFTPFTVLFTHIIANPLHTASDLLLLGQFVETLKSLRHISQGVATFARVCEVFSDVAELYARAKGQEAEAFAPGADAASLRDSGTVVGNGPGLAEAAAPSEPIASSDIGEYLAAIGFAPPMPQGEYSHVGAAAGDALGMADGGWVQDAHAVETGGVVGEDMTHLSDWFHGSSTLMELLDQDFQFGDDQGR